jgi:hypothetical protein
VSRYNLTVPVAAVPAPAEQVDHPALGVGAVHDRLDLGNIKVQTVRLGVLAEVFPGEEGLPVEVGERLGLLMPCSAGSSTTRK